MFGRRKDKDKEKEKKEAKDSKDVEEQLRKLQEQMDNLRERLGVEADREYSRAKRRRSDLEGDMAEFSERMAEFGARMGEQGKELGKYISMVVGDVMKGVDKTLRHTIFVGPKGRRIRFDNGEIYMGDVAAEAIEPVPPEEAQRLLSPLASAERIKILYLLSEVPQYHQDLMKESGLAPGTLPHHLKQLEEAGYITQERVRGRYLITIPGRMALKLAEYLHNQMREPKEKTSSEEPTEE